MIKDLFFRKLYLISSLILGIKLFNLQLGYGVVNHFHTRKWNQSTQSSMQTYFHNNDLAFMCFPVRETFFPDFAQAYVSWLSARMAWRRPEMPLNEKLNAF